MTVLCTNSLDLTTNVTSGGSLFVSQPPDADHARTTFHPQSNTVFPARDVTQAVRDVLEFDFKGFSDSTGISVSWHFMRLLLLVLVNLRFSCCYRFQFIYRKVTYNRNIQCVKKKKEKKGKNIIPPKHVCFQKSLLTLCYNDSKICKCMISSITITNS